MYEINGIKSKHGIIKLATKNNDIDKIFCLILYTVKDPYVVKCLEDKDIWRALNSRSGDIFNIYAIRPKSRSINTAYAYYTEETTHMFFTPLANELSDNNELIEELALSEMKDLPIIYFLNNDFGEAYTIPIEGSNKYEVYNDINDIITKVYKLKERDKFTFEHLRSTFLKRKVLRFIKKNSGVINVVSKFFVSKLN